MNNFELFNSSAEEVTAIEMIRGNTAEFTTSPINEDTGEEIILSGDDKILFIVKPEYGAEIFKKILTVADYDEENRLNITIKPEDTLNVMPGTYRYGITYMPADGAEAYTYAMGDFIIGEACGTVNDIKQNNGVTPNEPDSGTEGDADA